LKEKPGQESESDSESPTRTRTWIHGAFSIIAKCFVLPLSSDLNILLFTFRVSDNMAVLGVRAVSFLYSRKIIYSYRSPLISQLRYLRCRSAPINISNCRLVPVGRRFPERFTSCYSFVRWNSSSAASSGAQNPDVNIFIFFV